MWMPHGFSRRCDRHGLATRIGSLSLVLTAGCVGGQVGTTVVRAAPPELGAAPPWTAESAKADARLDPRIPTPESIIGHAVGEGAVRYESLIRYLKALDEASPLVSLTPYAESHEGRTLYHLTITSEAHHARLDQIKADNAKLLDPRKLTGSEEGVRLIESLPGMAWMAYAIHGDELSSTDAAVMLAYLLTAGTDEGTQRLRDELVIHIDPLMNPDGRERYLSQLQPLQGKVENPDHQAMQHTGLWSAGRGNHYLFDMNRDWLPLVHPETRGRAAKIIEWNPHLVVDSHEMGALDTYLFDPPREPFNVNLSETMLEWRRRFSADQARAFDQHGWSYYTREWYEAWYPGYTDIWASFHGAVGILYEQAGVNAALVKQRAGNILTYRDAVHHQLVSSLSNLETLRKNRRDILRDYLADHEWALTADQSGHETLLVPPVADRDRVARLADLLTRQGIEFGYAGTAVEAGGVVNVFGQKTEAKTFPAGSLVVRAAQPRRRLVRALLEFDPRMTESYLQDERKDLENRRGTRAYDVSAWNLCMAYGLDAYWAERVGEVTLREADQVFPRRVSDEPAYGYVIDGASADVHRAAARLLEAGWPVRVAIEPFTLGGHEFNAGSLLLRTHESPAIDPQKTKTLLEGIDVDVFPAVTALSEDGPDLGGQRFGLLVKPRVAVAMDWPVSTTSFGAAWFLLDARLGIRSSPCNIQALQFLDLRKYNVIVLPDVWNSSALGAVLNETVREKLKQWVQTGGTLIALGDAASFLAQASAGLSEVRWRQDVLDKLAVYQEAVEKERKARRIAVDSSKLWGDGSGIDDAGTEDKKSESAKPPEAQKPAGGADVEALKREDEWKRIFSPSGAFLNASINPEHWLCFGLQTAGLNEERMPVLVSGAGVLMSKHPVQTPIRLASKDQLRASGLLWPEAADRLADSAYVTVERVGYGQVILFRDDPFFRGYTEGMVRAYLNALIFGPGLGATQEVPW